ncbi:MAG: GFA family protein [Gymnodinialimonas sp.]
MSATARPQTVTYCHCSDCRRLSGAPVAAFAAFSIADPTFDPPLGAPNFRRAGVARWSCRTCGTQLAATYAYLPDQVYVPLGLLDQADTLAPEGHGHTDSALPWLHIEDDLPRDGASARARLQDAGPKG